MFVIPRGPILGPAPHFPPLYVQPGGRTTFFRTVATAPQLFSPEEKAGRSWIDSCCHCWVTFVEWGVSSSTKTIPFPTIYTFLKLMSLFNCPHVIVRWRWQNSPNPLPLPNLYLGQWHSWARTPRILRARGGWGFGLLHKVRTLLQWNPEARGGGVFIVRLPTT